MANRLNFYLNLLVTDEHLDDAFDKIEAADRAVMVDTAFGGVFYGLAVSERSGGANLSVDVSAGAAYDVDGRRCRTPSTQNAPVNVDYDAVSTAVVGVGNEKWLSISIRFKRFESGPFVDGNSLPGNLVQDEGYEWVVKQGAEAGTGLAVRPALVADAVLLADVLLIYGQTQVLDADISTTRRQLPFDLLGTPNSILAGRLGGTGGALDQLLGFVNDHVDGSADRHAASAIDYAGGGNWADATTNPAATVEVQLDKIITDLTGTGTSTGGTRKIAGEALPTGGGAGAIAAGTLFSQLNSLKYGGNLEYQGGGTWADGSTNPATSVEAQLDKVVSDIASTSSSGGLAKVGCGARTTWRGGRTNPAATSFSALDKVIVDISAQDAGDDGMERVGGEARTGSPNSLAVGSAASQAAELLGFVNARLTGYQDLGTLTDGGHLTLGTATGVAKFKAPGTASAYLTIVLPTPSDTSVRWRIFFRMLLNFGVASKVFFVAPAEGGTGSYGLPPTDYYGFFAGGAANNGHIEFLWNGSKWDIILSEGSDVAQSGGGAYA